MAGLMNIFDILQILLVKVAIQFSSSYKKRNPGCLCVSYNVYLLLQSSLRSQYWVHTKESRKGRVK